MTRKDGKAKKAIVKNPKKMEELKRGYDDSYTFAKNTLVEIFLECESGSADEKHSLEMLVEFKKFHKNILNGKPHGTDASIGRINRSMAIVAKDVMGKIMLESYLERALNLIRHLKDEAEMSDVAKTDVSN